MNDTDPILSKVRKLLALAEDPAATEHEAELYTAKATQLIADYGIDRALLACADPASDPVRDRLVNRSSARSRSEAWPNRCTDSSLAPALRRVRLTVAQRSRVAMVASRSTLSAA